MKRVYVLMLLGTVSWKYYNGQEETKAIHGVSSLYSSLDFTGLIGLGFGSTQVLCESDKDRNGIANTKGHPNCQVSRDNTGMT